MLYAVFLQQRPDGKYQASVPVMPGLTSIGQTRAETLRSIQQAIADTLTTGEWVYCEAPDQPSSPVNPWLATAGMFADDPMLEPMLQDIYTSRDVE